MVLSWYEKCYKKHWIIIKHKNIIIIMMVEMYVCQNDTGNYLTVLGIYNNKK